MKLLFTSCLCSRQHYRKLYSASPVKPGIQVQKYDRLLAQGFVKKGLAPLCLSAIPMSRAISGKLFFPSSREEQDQLCFHYLPVINLPLIKDAITLVLSFFSALMFCLKHRDAVLMGDLLSLPNTLGCALAFRLCRKKFLGVLTDLPEDVIDQKGMAWLYYGCLRQCTHYVFLTEAMKTKLSQNKPSLIMEGLVDLDRREEPAFHYGSKSGKECLYAGNCDQRNGIDRLIQAVLLLKNEQVQLHIFGQGDAADQIREIAAKEPQIHYYGVWDNEKVVEFQKRMDLLINPRPTEYEFTRYSFPSKNMEYMTSGVPLLTTPLAGMPEEYRPYVYLFEKETPAAMAETIAKVLALDREERKAMGSAARRFVLEQKNNQQAAERILQLLQQ